VQRVGKFSWAKWLVVLLVILLPLAAWIFRKPLSLSVGEFIVDRRSAELERHVGTNLPADFLVVRAVDESARSIAAFFDRPGILMLYSDKCPPCRSAVNQIRVSQAGGVSVSWSPVFFLLESDAISPPVGVPADRILYLDSRGKADWLVPKVTPVFYGIGSNGQLQSVRVGYDDLELAAQLEHLQMSSEGGSWIEK